MVADIHTDFFGFKERPFTLLPDPGFPFRSERFKRACSIPEYGISNRAPHTVDTRDEVSCCAVRSIHEEPGRAPRRIDKMCGLARAYAAAGIDAIRGLIADGHFIKTRPQEVCILQNPFHQCMGKAAE